jgi:hypothetical protein
MYLNDVYYVPGTSYAVKLTFFDTADCGECLPCDCGSHCTAIWGVYKYYGTVNETSLGAHGYCEAEETFDGSKICIAQGSFSDVPPESASLYIYVNNCSTYDDTYVNSSTGNDDRCCNDSLDPCLTYSRAFDKVNSGGTIHVLNNGADFSSESKNLNKTHYATSTSGYSFYLPKST